MPRGKHKPGKHKHKAKDGAAPKPHARLSVAAQINFQNMLDKADLDGDGEIDLDELKIAMDNQTFSWDVSKRKCTLTNLVCCTAFSWSWRQSSTIDATRCIDESPTVKYAQLAACTETLFLFFLFGFIEGTLPPPGIFLFAVWIVIFSKYTRRTISTHPRYVEFKHGWFVRVLLHGFANSSCWDKRVSSPCVMRVLFFPFISSFLYKTFIHPLLLTPFDSFRPVARMHPFSLRHRAFIVTWAACLHGLA